MTSEELNNGDWIAVAQIPDEQKLTMTIGPVEGRMLHADTVGKTIINFANVLTSLAKELEDQRKLFPAVTKAQLHEDGSFEFQLALLPISEESK